MVPRAIGVITIGRLLHGLHALLDLVDRLITLRIGEYVLDDEEALQVEEIFLTVIHVSSLVFTIGYGKVALPCVPQPPREKLRKMPGNAENGGIETTVFGVLM